MGRVAKDFQRREAVGAVGRRGETERELRTEVAEQLLIRFVLRGRMVGFVDDQIREIARGETIQMFERLCTVPTRL